MYKLDLEKAEEPEIKLQHSLDHGKRKGVPKKNTSTSASLTTLKSLCASQQTVKNSKQMRVADTLTCLLRKPVCGSRGNRTGHRTRDWFKIRRV